MRFAFNTNGLAHHLLADGLDLLSELGYDGVALTLDVHHVHPFEVSHQDLDRLRGRLDACGLAVTIETGARFLLDPRRKHHPSLAHDERAVRTDYLKRAISVAERLGAESVTFFSGRAVRGVAPEVQWQRVADASMALLDCARERSVRLGFEPEPGHLIASLADFDRLRALGDGELGLTLDVGHVVCTESCGIPEAIERYGSSLVGIHLEDIRGREHLHLPFGDGDLDFPPILRAIEEVGYAGLCAVELSRSSHRAPEVAEHALAFLRGAALSAGCAL